MSSLWWLKVLIFFIFILFSAFCSSAETAYTAISRIKMRSMLARKVKGAQALARVLDSPKKLITAILIGNNVANVGASVIATTLILDFLHALGFVNFAADMLIVMLITTFIILVFGEITPKTFVIKRPERYALMMTTPVYVMLILLNPLVLFFHYLNVVFSRLFGLSAEVGTLLTAEEIKALVKIAEEDGILEKEEQQMIDSIFEFSKTIVREIMIPRTDAVFIDINSSVPDAIALIQSQGHSRLPVYEPPRLDNVQGIVHAKDLLGVQDPKLTIKNFVRESKFIPETATIEIAMQLMKHSHVHMAIVVDEYGGLAGIITLEDIIEEIFGDIQDEFDGNERPLFQELSHGRYLVDASIHIDDLAERMDHQFPETENYDSLGGLVLSHFGKFPKRGEKLILGDLEIIVKETCKRRILQLEVVRIN